MKGRIIIASILFVLGLTAVIDWIIFTRIKEYENLNWQDFKIKYVEHLPEFLQPLYRNPVISTMILFVFFTIAGILFMKTKKILFFLGIISFVLAFWQLFSLM